MSVDLVRVDFVRVGLVRGSLMWLVSFPGLCCIYHLQYRNFCVNFLLQATNMKGEACTGFGSGKLELGKALLALYSGNFRGRKLSSEISKFCRYL